MFSRLFRRGRRARLAWEGELDWFRLRYQTPAGPARCLALLSRPEACARVALCYRPDAAVSRLYLGVPRPYARLVRRMAADFAFSLQPETPDALSPPPPLRPAAALPWERPFLAHVVDGALFVSPEAAAEGGGAYFPSAPASPPEEEDLAWALPQTPPLGMTTRPEWNGAGPPAHLVATGPDDGRWLLGRTGDGRLLSAAGRVNVYGRREAVADWLAYQVTGLLARNPANLVVIDGGGDLVPRLKRKAAVTRLLGERLTYVDVDGAALIEGINPLAPAPESTIVLTACRAGSVATLAGRFLGNDARLAEKLSLLGRGEGMVVRDGLVTYAAWRASAQ